MNLTIGFSKARSRWAFLSMIICAVERRPYSHAYVKHSHPVTDVQLVAQASHGLVHQINFDLFRQKNIIVKEYMFQLESQQNYAFLKFLHENLGKPYSRLQLLYIGIKKLCGLEAQIVNGSSAYICSEFVARLLETLSIATISSGDYITPSDLEKLIQIKAKQ